MAVNKRERISEVRRIQNRKIAKEESRRKAKERILSCVPDVLGEKLNLAPTNPPGPAPEKRRRPQECKRIK